MSFSEDIKYYIAASYPCLYVVAREEWRAQKEIEDVCQKINIKHHSWTLSNGLDFKFGKNFKTQPQFTDPVDFIKDRIKNTNGDVYSIINFHFFLDTPEMVQLIKDVVQLGKAEGQVLIFISNVWKIPQELLNDITRIDFTLPEKELLGQRIDYVLSNEEIKEKKIQEPNEQEKDSIIDAALGMSTWEFENSLMLSILKKGKIDPKFIGEEKAKTVAKSGILEFFSPDINMSDVGGLENLKEWLKLRRKIFSQEAKKYGLNPPRGILMVGQPGCGKSLIAKTIANDWGIPLIKFDLGKLFAGIVGASEERTRTALELAEAVAPCVLFIDEIEKGMAGINSSGNTDSGVTSRVFGNILTWMQERKRPVFMVATANDISNLPPALLRAGRWDEIFFVDLPNENERKDILSIHIKRTGRDVIKYNLEKVIEITDTFSGAELAAIVEKAMITAFSEDREFNENDLINAAKRTIPLASTRSEDVEALRNWATNRAISASKVIPIIKQAEATRKIKLNI